MVSVSEDQTVVEAPPLVDNRICMATELATLDNTHETTAEKEIKLVDHVSYEGLTPGQEYEINVDLHPAGQDPSSEKAPKTAYGLQRGWSGFHVGVGTPRRGWFGFHPGACMAQQGWSGFHVGTGALQPGWFGFHGDVCMKPRPPLLWWVGVYVKPEPPLSSENAPKTAYGLQRGWSGFHVGVGTPQQGRSRFHV